MPSFFFAGEKVQPMVEAASRVALQLGKALEGNPGGSGLWARGKCLSMASCYLPSHAFAGTTPSPGCSSM